MKVDKYVFVTALLMERPWHPITVFLNTIVPRIYHYKSKAENYLRRSGINYAIVRPPGLVGDDKNTTVTPYSIGQGDKMSGHITRCTLGKVILDTIESSTIQSTPNSQKIP